MIKPIMTWAEINANWAHIMDVLRQNLPLDQEIMIDKQGRTIPAGRPMLEDIVCLRAASDDHILMYFAAAGMPVTLSRERAPRVIEVGARNKIGFGQGGSGNKA